MQIVGAWSTLVSVLLEGQEKKQEQERARQEGARKWEIVNPYMYTVLCFYRVRDLHREEMGGLVTYQEAQRSVAHASTELMSSSLVSSRLTWSSVRRRVSSVSQMMTCSLWHVRP
ncbi:hypothetical protein RRG08_037397 [Elysia crispata]|uniref:Uncharacterized protein n=1 Tax=Elysia crispata TaxID=231223 RepID=A0AAE1DY20_9GAST|nr:hypothetical protein RRG08_037397 [Elysia crispata]